jgi:phosphatidylinositol glycan class B
MPDVQKSHFALLFLSLPPAIYVVMSHCSAPITVMGYLRQLPTADSRQSIGFLMPCHSTPWQAYLHKPQLAIDNRLWALGCEPPLQ